MLISVKYLKILLRFFDNQGKKHIFRKDFYVLSTNTTAVKNHNPIIREMMVDYQPTQQSKIDLRVLKELVRHGENKFVEFKLKTTHPEKIVREMVAFANTDGGKLIVGIGDDKSIKGLKFPDEDEYILQKAIEKYIYPAIDYTLERLIVEGEREVLIYDIQKSPFKPHYVDIDGIAENRRAYVRVADRSVQA
ncbi:MAG: ATP-binding protein, partial [Emticicia sp.]|nr:ATP-binding protein [Emticicia sp.]